MARPTRSRRFGCKARWLQNIGAVLRSWSAVEREGAGHVTGGWPRQLVNRHLEAANPQGKEGTKCCCHVSRQPLSITARGGRAPGPKERNAPWGQSGDGLLVGHGGNATQRLWSQRLAAVSPQGGLWLIRFCARDGRTDRFTTCERGGISPARAPSYAAPLRLRLG